MTAQEFRALRQRAGASQAEWAQLLHCSYGAVRNMEGGKPIGQQTALLATLLAHPTVRRLLPAIFAYRTQVYNEAKAQQAAVATAQDTRETR
jgi:DNA-binding XRE family transcriptional regulator